MYASLALRIDEDLRHASEVRLVVAVADPRRLALRVGRPAPRVRLAVLREELAVLA